MATNQGTATAYPILRVTGPGRLYEIANYTIDSAIYFDLELQSGEEVTLDLRPGKKTLISTFRGNIIHAILEGSDVQGFRLIPGGNDISIYIDNATAVAHMTWENRHWSIDGGAR